MALVGRTFYGVIVDDSYLNVDKDKKTLPKHIDTKIRGRYKVHIPELMHHLPLQDGIWCRNRVHKNRNFKLNIPYNQITNSKYYLTKEEISKLPKSSNIHAKYTSETRTGITDEKDDHTMARTFGSYFPLHPNTIVNVEFYEENYDSGYIVEIISDFSDHPYYFEPPKESSKQGTNDETSSQEVPPKRISSNMYPLPTSSVDRDEMTIVFNTLKYNNHLTIFEDTTEQDLALNEFSISTIVWADKVDEIQQHAIKDDNGYKDPNRVKFPKVYTSEQVKPKDWLVLAHGDNANIIYMNRERLTKNQNYSSSRIKEDADDEFSMNSSGSAGGMHFFTKNHFDIDVADFMTVDVMNYQITRIGDKCLIDVGENRSFSDRSTEKVKMFAVEVNDSLASLVSHISQSTTSTADMFMKCDGIGVVTMKTIGTTPADINVSAEYSGNISLFNTIVRGSVSTIANTANGNTAYYNITATGGNATVNIKADTTILNKVQSSSTTLDASQFYVKADTTSVKSKTIVLDGDVRITGTLIVTKVINGEDSLIIAGSITAGGSITGG